MRDLKGI